MADLTRMAEETAERLRATTDATRQVIGVAEALAESIGDGVARVRKTGTTVTAVADAVQHFSAASARVRQLAAALEEAASQLTR